MYPPSRWRCGESATNHCDPPVSGPESAIPTAPRVYRGRVDLVADRVTGSPAAVSARVAGLHDEVRHDAVDHDPVEETLRGERAKVLDRQRGVLGEKLDPNAPRTVTISASNDDSFAARARRLVILRREARRDRDRAERVGGRPVLLDEQPTRLLARDGVRVVRVRGHEGAPGLAPRRRGVEGADREVRLSRTRTRGRTPRPTRA